MKSQTDPLALASETPDINALIKEFELAMDNGACSVGNIGSAEDTRFNRWTGKSPERDGCRWQKNAPANTIVRPYDGRPDTDVQLTDEICAAEVDMLMTAYAMAQINATTTHVTPLTAAQVAELRAVGEWCRRVIRDDLTDALELLAQMMTALGWAVINPGWLERWELVDRELDLESFIVQVAQLAGPENARALYSSILDEDLEDAAVTVVQQLFAHLPKGRSRQIVRDLRTKGQTSFLDRQIAERRPTLRTLIPGYNYFISGSTSCIGKARGHLVVERFYEADLRATAAANGWNTDFVDAVVNTAGKYSAEANAQRQNSTLEDAEDRSIEIWTTYVLQFDEETQAAGVYCTTFSPHLSPGQSGRAGTPLPAANGSQGTASPTAYYAHHYLLAFAHGRPPFVQARREVIGPALDDSRGVPDMVRSDQKVIKDLQDAAVVRAHLEVNPPRAFLGFGGTKVADWNKPGAKIESLIPGADVKDLGPTKGNPQFAELAIQRVEDGTHRRFALPSARDESHPAAWQMRQMRNTKRWLSAWGEAFWQLAVLAYQELDETELTAIIGHPPQLNVSDLLRHRIELTFDARALDNDWTKQVLDFVIQLLGIDTAGLMDRGPIIQLALAYIDPTIVSHIMRSPEGASAALYQQVEHEVAMIMDGNPPQLRENDASAGMQLQMAFAVLGKNQNYQEQLKQDPMVQENLETYFKNLQHNQQETQISPQQGRLGVQAQPERPVQQGNSMMI